MPSKTLPQYLIIAFKGLAMGAADVVPGVSGGTIAFISGIYEELIETIHKLDFGVFKLWKEKGLAKAWQTYNLGFLFALFGGVAISIISFAKLITYLLNEYPILVWSFFFGLVIASIFYIGKQIKKFTIPILIAIAIAIAISYAITLAKPIADTNSTWFLFLAGFIAIIAMILPGISGAFILLLLGAYQAVLGTVTKLWDSLMATNWDQFSQAFLKLLVFIIGAVVGLKVFSGALNWMFKHHKGITLAVLTGFMIGALNKIWPWKEVLEYRLNSHQEEVPFLEKSIWPAHYDGDPQVLLAIVFMVLGFVSIFALERIAAQKNKE